MCLKVRLFLIAILFSASSLVLHAATITSVSFGGDAANPTITVFGSGFGSAPTPTALAYLGYTGLDYGTNLHVTDSSTHPLFDAGYDDPGAGYHDIIGLVNLTYTDALISFNLGSVYTSGFYPLHFNEGDTYTVHVGGNSFTGIVAYTPEPTPFALLATGCLGLLGVTRRRFRQV